MSEQLVLLDGELIPMSSIVCITWGKGYIQVFHTCGNALYCLDWFAATPTIFNTELNRTTREYMDYLDRRGIPKDEVC